VFCGGEGWAVGFNWKLEGLMSVRYESRGFYVSNEEFVAVLRRAEKVLPKKKHRIQQSPKNFSDANNIYFLPTLISKKN
jgi:hypothetical protein